MNAALWQHVVAIALAAGALGWLVRRAVKGGGSKATGPCASCPASRGRGGIALSLAKTHTNVRPETPSEESRPAIRS